MEYFDEALNRILVDAYHNVLKLQELSLKKESDITLSINEIHLIEAVGDISKSKQPTVSDIAAALGITRPSTTVAVTKLEGKKYLRRLPCENDGRAVHVVLTKKGVCVYNAHKEYHKKLTESITHGLSEVDRHLLANAFNNLNNFLKDSLADLTAELPEEK